MKRLIVKNTNFLEDSKVVYLPFSNQNLDNISVLYKNYTNNDLEVKNITKNVYITEFDLQYFFSSIKRSNSYVIIDPLIIHQLFKDFDEIIIIGYNPIILVEIIQYYQAHRYNMLANNKRMKIYVNEKLSDVKIEEKEFSGILHKFRYYKYNKEKFDSQIKKNLVRIVVAPEYYHSLNYIKLDKELLIYLYEDSTKFKIYQDKILKKNVSRIISQIPEEEKLAITNKINFPIGLIDSLVKIEVNFNKFDYNRINTYFELNSYEENVIKTLNKNKLYYPLLYNYITSKSFPSYEIENEYLQFKEVVSFE